MTSEQFLKYHSIYERKAYTIIRKAIKDSITINWDNITEENYKYVIPLNINLETLKQGYFDLYFQIGLLHGKRMGYGINREIKAFSLDSFTSVFRNIMVSFIEKIAVNRITSVSQTLAQYLINEMNTRLQAGEAIRPIAGEMAKLVNSRDFYKWQALRIARTETTAAANKGAYESGLDSGVVMEKEWITAQDERVRRRPDDEFDHRAMNGQRTEPYQEFIVPGKNRSEYLLYPGDPVGSAANVIQCRCTLAWIPKRDQNGNLIFK